MGFWGLVCGILVEGCILGIWTACGVFHERQRANEDAPEQLSKPSLLPTPLVAGIPEPSR